MYEVLDRPKYETIKSKNVKLRSRPPERSGGGAANNRPSKWSAMILIAAGTSIEKLNHIPEGSLIKLCSQDRQCWEVLIPVGYTKNIRLLAKRLDAIAFL
tara:strand:+ start:27 stop:326 length:300 start_codon:yes stop_codon:yes gene_type:complete